MQYSIYGNTSAAYGNPDHRWTLAGGVLVFVAGAKEDASTSWGWAPMDLGQLGGQVVGSAIVSEDGSFDATLREYRGGPLLVAINVEKFSYAPATGRSASGVLGLVVPAWKETNDGLRAQIDIALGVRSYCGLLQALDLWLVAGRVTDCATHATPLVGGTVFAFDRDLTQDDALGNGVTDAAGNFWIFFSSAVFKQVPTLPPPFDNILPHELVGGPDLYFQVMSGATVLLDEAPSQGRIGARENVSNCSFNELCVTAPAWTPDTVTLWSSVGDYHVPDGGGLHDFDADGLVDNGKLAFCGDIDLNGQLSQAWLGEALSIRFMVAEWADLATAPAYPADYQPLLGANLDLNQPYGGIYTFVGPSPWDFTITDVLPAPDANGWIAVSQSANFVRNTGRLVRVRTSTLAPAVGVTYGTTPDAGQAVPAGLQDRPRKFSFVLEVRTASFSGHQTVPVPLHLNNSLAYLDFDLTELSASTCAGLTPVGGVLTLHPEYTVAHPYLRSYSISVERQGGALTFLKDDAYTAHGSLWTDAAGEHGTFTGTYTDVGPCSYRCWINVYRRLTNGTSGVSHQSILRTFCVG